MQPFPICTTEDLIQTLALLATTAGFIQIGPHCTIATGAFLDQQPWYAPGPIADGLDLLGTEYWFFYSPGAHPLPANGAQELLRLFETYNR